MATTTNHWKTPGATVSGRHIWVAYGYLTRHPSPDGLWRLRLGGQSSNEGMGYQEPNYDWLLQRSKKAREEV